MRRALLLALVTVVLLGCGAAFDGTVYRSRGLSFRVGPVPGGWQPITTSHAALSYRDVENQGVVAVNGRCGVDGEDVPLASLTQHLFLQFTEREILEQKVVPFDGREALHSVLVAKLDGVPKKFDVWVLKKDGCVYDLYYFAPPDRFARGAAGFDRFARGFATVSSHAD